MHAIQDCSTSLSVVQDAAQYQHHIKNDIACINQFACVAITSHWCLTLLYVNKWPIRIAIKFAR